MSADRNLLFGILALQMDFVTRDQLVTAMNAWVLTKQTPLGKILVEQNALTSELRALLESLGAWNAAWVPPACGPVEYLDRLGLLDRHLIAVRRRDDRWLVHLAIRTRSRAVR